ncbi:MAG: RNA polymerase sigma factor [Paludibacter sp.]
MKSNRIYDEQEIIKGCKNGESWAQKLVYEQHASTMMSVCMRYAGDYETARDLLQDGFIKVFTKIESYTGVGAFGGWIRRIFVTTALEFLRQNSALKQSEELDDHHLKFEDNQPTILDKITADELLNCVAQLSDGYRTVFNLYAIEGYSHAEIAESLQISENTSRSQFMRARNILQKNIEKLIGNEYVQQYRK